MLSFRYVNSPSTLFSKLLQVQAYGAPQPAAGVAGFDYGTIRAKLQQMVQENKLQHFYPPQRLDQVAQQLTTKDIKGLGHRWRLPSEVNLDLVTLALCATLSLGGVGGSTFPAYGNLALRAVLSLRGGGGRKAYPTFARNVEIICHTSLTVLIRDLGKCQR